MNSVDLIGRLADTPQCNYTPSGTAVVNINLAIDDGRGAEKKTLWIGHTFWGTTAENLAKFAVKGQSIGITGRLSQDVYTPKDSDRPVRKTHVTVSHFTFGEKPRGSSGARSTPAAAASTSSSEAAEPDTSDDIPF